MIIISPLGDKDRCVQHEHETPPQTAAADDNSTRSNQNKQQHTSHTTATPTLKHLKTIGGSVRFDSPTQRAAACSTQRLPQFASDQQKAAHRRQPVQLDNLHITTCISRATR
jgi:hypothetical protein